MMKFKIQSSMIYRVMVRFMMFNATFNTIAVISWRSV
jgi:hypothetical protein